MLPIGTQVGAFFYAGSGTPVSRTVYSINNIPLFVDGRGSLGRTPMLSQTDLLVSHDIRMAGSKRLRLEANILNLFNQKTARHIFDSVNRPRRASLGDQPGEHEPGERVRLQRAARRDARRRQRERSALPDGRPLQPRVCRRG